MGPKTPCRTRTQAQPVLVLLLAGSAEASRTPTVPEQVHKNSGSRRHVWVRTSMASGLRI